MKKLELYLEVDDDFASLIAAHVARRDYINITLSNTIYPDPDISEEDVKLVGVPVIGMRMVGKDAFGKWVDI